MNLRDAKAQIERNHPELTGTAKIEAIKALREAVAAEQQDGHSAPEKAEPDTEQLTVPQAWSFFVVVFAGVRVIGWAIWGDPWGMPVWFDVVYLVLLGAAVAGLVSAYRQRP
ncbi:hypothetical protein [Streptomyces sp. 891-h]|uniref:hypothetical protein n=1 Tax=Streptomyces sp. 891-h TaxID=2720714 RepID=UPI001FAB22B4|nr:hypothetical protein [Streptomyces sp. 891-h]UNZ20625.1 hypothetical protein HC362_29735 [Streptomyces sp. 891-h]